MEKSENSSSKHKNILLTSKDDGTDLIHTINFDVIKILQITVLYRNDWIISNVQIAIFTE